MSFQKTEEQEWIERRVREVGRAYNAYSALTEFGVELQDESTSQQIFCPFHDNKRTPAARYYAPSGRHQSHFWCFKCHTRLDGVGLYSKFKGVGFMEALSAIEKRFGISTPKRPEFIGINPSDRGSDYVSEAWGDVPRLISILEGKLGKTRDLCSLHEYVKFCRLMDAVLWDYDVLGRSTPEMTSALMRAGSMMDEIMSRENLIA